ncbi:MAG: hypothetical protein R3359_07545 [Marinirhabdus sp.]|nr:hypothetical protein [Marinirhabdus sp.]
MAFVGYIASVIARKSNDARKERKKASFQKKTSYGTGIYKKFVDHQHMSASELSAFQVELQKKNRSHTLKMVVLVLLSAIVTGVLVYYGLEYLTINF